MESFSENQKKYKNGSFLDSFVQILAMLLRSEINDSDAIARIGA